MKRLFKGEAYRLTGYGINYIIGKKIISHKYFCPFCHSCPYCALKPNTAKVSFAKNYSTIGQ
ncbi:MAG: hypothetical protein LBJ00_00720 [Planctomycetaceae bacterium]|nr:hypothetical protein [Planctomycetaceae bacterium]